MNFRVGNAPFTARATCRSLADRRLGARARIGIVAAPRARDPPGRRRGRRRRAVRRAPDPSRPDRPWVGLCMIASLDGTTVVDGRSGALGNATDTPRARRPAPGRGRRARRGGHGAGGGLRATAASPACASASSPRTACRRDSALFTSGAGFLVDARGRPAAPARRRRRAGRPRRGRPGARPDAASATSMDAADVRPVRGRAAAQRRAARQRVRRRARPHRLTASWPAGTARA